MAASGVLLSRFTGLRDLAYGGTAVLCLAIAAAAVAHLAGNVAPVSLVLPVGLPGAVTHLRVDSLSALFLLVVNVGGVTACLFGMGHDRMARSVGFAGHADRAPVRTLVPLFLAGMNGVLIADDVFAFLLSWEFMSVSSWLLVLSTHRDAATRRAAHVYLVMASFGTVMLMLGFATLIGTAHGASGAFLGDYSFAGIRAGSPAVLPATIAMLLILLGTGSKAGMVPLHVWLPLAHPAAPSHVSALMSGVMTKVAIYGLVRVVFDLIAIPQWWWGAAMLPLGAVTAVLGILYALMQHDIKRLLAYSTVENIGVILIDIALAIVFKSLGVSALAALALTAALLHVVNHSLYKSLLFYGAGAVLAATGQRDLDALGGLIHRMPITSFVWLIGAAAISSLPPLNGFVSEWLSFQAILNGPLLEQWELKIGIAVTGALLALATGLAGACFVRAYGITFLGRPRSNAAAQAGEVTALMKASMIIPAALSVAIGVVPTLVISLLEPVTRAMVGEGLYDGGGRSGWLWVSPASAFGNSYSGFIMIAVIALMSVVAALVLHRYASARLRRAAAWDCGFGDAGPTAQYSAGSFSQPIRRIFLNQVFSARDTVVMPPPGDTAPARFSLELRDPAWDWLFTPIEQLMGRIADRANLLQFMTIRQYLSLMFGALVLLLVVVAVTQS